MELTLWKYISDTDGGTHCSLYLSEEAAWRAMVANILGDDATLDPVERAAEASMRAAVSTGAFDIARDILSNYLEASGSIDTHYVESEMIKIESAFSSRELATTLHSLRVYQELTHGIKREGCVCRGNCCDHFDDENPLTDAEIDSLCERINLDANGNLTIDAPQKPERKARKRS